MRTFECCTRDHLARLAVCGTLLGALSGCGWFADLRDEQKGIHLEQLAAPPGYKVELLARDIPKARQMAIGPGAVLLVGTNEGKVHALTLDAGKVTRSQVVASGLKDGSGVAYFRGTLFVSDRTRILRYDNAESRLDQLASPAVVLDGLADKERHASRFMAIGPDSKLYVSVGSPCDVCEANADEYGLIVRVDPGGGAREVVARGVRNTVGFDWHPGTRELWFTENGQDDLGPDQPNDELNRITRAGQNFGFPYCHDRNIADPKFGAKHACTEFAAPAFGLGAHVAPLGMRFMKADTASGGDSILVARHGSHPPSRVGYDVVRVRLAAGGGPSMEPFLRGFLQGRKYWGRPADVLPMPDGSVLVSDDLNGAIYRVAR